MESIGWSLCALQKHCVQKAEVYLPKGETLSRNFEAGNQAVSTAVLRGRVLQERGETHCPDVCFQGSFAGANFEEIGNNLSPVLSCAEPVGGTRAGTWTERGKHVNGT